MRDGNRNRLRLWLWLLPLVAHHTVAQANSRESTGIHRNVPIQCPAQGNPFGDYLVAHLMANLPDAVMIDDISSDQLLSQMEARVGVMKSFSTLKRVGEVHMGTDDAGDLQTFNLNVTFGEFTVEYDHYQFKVGYNSESYGSLVAKCYGTLVEIQMRISRQSICSLEVVDIIIYSLDDFKVQMRSACKICPKIRTGVMDNVIRFFKDKIRFDTNTRLLHSLPSVIRLNRAVCKRLKDGV